MAMEFPMLPALPELQPIPNFPLPAKIPQQLVLYRETPPPPVLDNYECQNCPMYHTGLCNIVDGTIKPTAWCMLWLPRRPPFSYILEKINIPQKP